MVSVSDIEKRIDRAIAAPIPVNAELGGLMLQNMGEVMEFAKLMSVSGAAVPPWLRNNPGGCLAICSRALRWKMDPFAVAEKSYLAKGKGGTEHIGYEAQLIHAVVTAHAPLKGRLRTEIIGEGELRRCKVWGTFKGETKPHEYISETLANKIKAIGRNSDGYIKGSPLWESDPEVQLSYSAVRQWCRLHSPDTLLGVYTPDELGDPVERAAETTVSSFAQRLRDAKAARVGERGFDHAHVARVIEGEAKETNDAGENGSGEREGKGSDHRRSDRDEAGIAGPGSTAKGVGTKPAREKTAREKQIEDEQQEIPFDTKPQPKKGKPR
jgi:RecT family